MHSRAKSRMQSQINGRMRSQLSGTTRPGEGVSPRKAVQQLFPAIVPAWEWTKNLGMTPIIGRGLDNFSHGEGAVFFKLWAEAARRFNCSFFN